MSFQITVGSIVTLHLSLTLEDGTVADSTFGEEPFTFTMGDGTLVGGLELALYGLYPGNTQRLELTAEQAFGLRDPQHVHTLPRTAFNDDIELAPGVIVGFETPEGEELAGAVLDLDEDSATVDFNHPLAGHSVIFEVEIIDVEPPDGVEE
jgi:FKBP-type peptidyl-prolyl cis-trans isomerase SlpA